MYSSYYQVGGSLANDHPSYVERKADTELYEAVKQGEFCYVLNCRQMGKSSLAVRTRYRLQEEGFLCTTVDLTRVGSEMVTPQQWYKGIATDLCLGLGIFKKVKLKSWWQEKEELSLLQRLGYFLEDILLAQIPDQNIVIFLDEIDSILSLGFPVDDFFALIRFCYNQRKINPEYNRITWVICGVATPSDLIQNRQRTPFNIGKAIDLQGFTLEEAEPLVPGLKAWFENSRKILQEILAWTGGQPFLTQKLCNLLIEFSQKAETNFSEIVTGNESFWVEKLVKSSLIENWEDRDEPEHLKTIRNRLLHKEKWAGRLLGIYQQILQGVEIPLDQSHEQGELLISGLVVKSQGLLKVKNPIYQAVFNLEWVERKLNALRPYSQLLEAWVAADRVDPSRLLRGQALRDAQAWAQGKSLSDLDYQFLAASEELDRKEVQQALEAARIKEVEARLIEEGKRLAEEQKNAQRQKIFIATLSTALFIATGLGITAFWQYRKAVQSENIARINEIQALASSSEGLFASNRRLDALIEALRARKKMLSLGEVDADTKSQVELVLQQAILGADEYNRLSKPASGLYGIAFSPDGKKIAATGIDNTVNLWTREGKLLKMFKGNQASVSGVVFSRDGQLIASGSSDRTLKLWRLDGTLIHTFKGHQAIINNIDISPNEQFLASVSEDGTIKLWRRDGTLLKTLNLGRALNWAVVFTRDSRKILVGKGNGDLTVWQVDGQQLATIPAHAGAILGIAITRQGDTIASASTDGTIKLWKFSGNIPVLLTTLKGHNGIVFGVAFSPDGTQLASVSDDKTVKLWQRVGKTWDNPQLLRSFAGHSAMIMDVEFSPDGKTIASQAWDNTVRLWKPDNPLLKSLNGHQALIFGIAFSPDSQMLASVGMDKTVKLWEIGDRATLGVILRSWKTDQGLMGVSFSPDGKRLAVANTNGILQLWTREGKFLATLTGHTGTVRRLQFSPDGTLLASGSGDGTVGLWNVAGKTPVLLAKLTGHQAGVWVASFSLDGQIIASCSGDGTIKLWTKNGKLLHTIKAHQSVIRSIAFSPDGQLLASGSDDKTVKLWRLDGTLVKTLAEHQDAVRTVAFSPDGKLLAAGSGDGIIKLSQPDGTLLTTLKVHTGGIWQVAFSPDGKQLASAGEDRSVMLWNVEKVRSLDGIVASGCDWIQDYLRTNGELSQNPSQPFGDGETRHLCDDVTGQRGRGAEGQWRKQ
ncbi:AAA-like domain-containing protein [Microseira wollei]|uniref:WD-40 repeat-containing protein n=1 Tax=Microseira wollei NIES-4236 TaxID=2530354 RepID=A0AAV3X7Q6_9CYAN|nr:AAA-like domain-containing protein [Microseira wollei]GET38408.1 WD-40 repeat-containing protein [Microseira wollei NIES-4236]